MNDQNWNEFTVFQSQYYVHCTKVLLDVEKHSHNLLFYFCGKKKIKGINKVNLGLSEIQTRIIKDEDHYWMTSRGANCYLWAYMLLGRFRVTLRFITPKLDPRLLVTQLYYDFQTKWVNFWNGSAMIQENAFGKQCTIYHIH